MTRKKVALIYGGNSSEWEISILSGKNVAAHIDRSRYDVYEILLRGTDWSVCDRFPLRRWTRPISPP